MTRAGVRRSTRARRATWPSPSSPLHSRPRFAPSWTRRSVSSSSGAGSFFDQFIEDYYAECDEHLGTARRVLLALEASPADGSPAPPLHELLRSLHTLKGLSGMVGDGVAEQVAHAIEDAVRGAERTPG